MATKVSPFAGKPAESSMLVNVPKLITAYYTDVPDPSASEERVAFGTSGHRGSAFDNAFNEQHILAISQAICLYRSQHKINGPLFLGKDTHALSSAAQRSALGDYGITLRLKGWIGIGSESEVVIVGSECSGGVTRQGSQPAFLPEPGRQYPQVLRVVGRLPAPDGRECSGNIPLRLAQPGNGPVSKAHW